MMGVSIEYISSTGKREDVTPGFRSMMASLLDSYRGRKLYADDIPELEAIAETQYRGEKEDGFDWSQEIHDNIHKIIAAIQRDEWVIVTMEW
jgi:hypothetical protein